MKCTVFALGSVIVAAVANIAHAQAPYAGFSWQEPHHSATVDESRGRGWGAAQMGNAQVIQAQGVAAEAFQRARQQAIYNQLAENYARDQLREMNEAVRVAKNARATQPQQASPGSASERQGKTMPARPSPADISADGSIRWPDLLTADEYRQTREAIEALFRQRAGIPTGQRMAVRKAVEEQADQLTAELVKRVDNYNHHVADYITAKTFIRNLRNEARFDNANAIAAR